MSGSFGSVLVLLASVPADGVDDLFYAVERFVEGDRRERMRKAGGPLTVQRVREIATEHAILAVHRLVDRRRLGAVSPTLRRW